MACMAGTGCHAREVQRQHCVYAILACQKKNPRNNRKSGIKHVACTLWGCTHACTTMSTGHTRRHLGLILPLEQIRTRPCCRTCDVCLAPQRVQVRPQIGLMLLCQAGRMLQATRPHLKSNASIAWSSKDCVATRMHLSKALVVAWLDNQRLGRRGMLMLHQRTPQQPPADKC